MQPPQRIPYKILIRFRNTSSEAAILPPVKAITETARLLFAVTSYSSPLPDILTRYPWHQANLVPSQMPKEEEKLACQTRSDHQSAAAALLQSCSSEHNTCPWDHLPGYQELKDRVTFRMGPKMLDILSTLETINKVWQCLICWVWFFPCFHLQWQCLCGHYRT